MQKRTKIIIAVAIIIAIVVSIVLGLTLGNKAQETPPQPPPPPPLKDKLPPNHPMINIQIPPPPPEFLLTNECVLQDGNIELKGTQKGDYCFFEGLKTNDIDEYKYDPLSEYNETYPPANIGELELACGRRPNECVGYDSDLRMLGWSPSIDYWYKKWPQEKDKGTYIRVGKKIKLRNIRNACKTPSWDLEREHFDHKYCSHPQVIPPEHFLRSEVQSVECKDEPCQLREYEKQCESNPECFAFTSTGLLYENPKAFQNEHANIDKWESIKKYIPAGQEAGRSHGTFVKRNHQGSEQKQNGGLFSYLFPS